MISGFVVTYNRAELLPTCLRSIRFVDELVVIDKSSTDGSYEIAEQYADRVHRVAWSPTVEETRAFAMSCCHGDWVAFLDDDEMFSPGAIEYLATPRAETAAPIVMVPRHQWILGAYNSDAYSYPDHLCRFFKRGTVGFAPTVHEGVILLANAEIEEIPAESDRYIDHLSHPDVATWIERTNRYTSRPDRIRADASTDDLIGYAHGALEFWLERTHRTDRGDHAAALAVLRAIYDMVDRLKVWEERRGLDGAAEFRDRCAELQRRYDALGKRWIRTR